VCGKACLDPLAAARHTRNREKQEGEMPIDTDDLEPLRKKPKPRELDSLSLEELNDYIANMEAEIKRVREKIAAKQKHSSAAAALFKK